MKNKFELIVRCSKCTAINYWAPYCAANENTYCKTCPVCKEQTVWVDSLERWVSTAKWWNPKTWLNGYWEKQL